MQGAAELSCISDGNQSWKQFSLRCFTTNEALAVLMDFDEIKSASPFLEIFYNSFIVI